MKFVGEFEHSLDPKGRVVLPAIYRTRLADRCFLTFMGDCIGIYTEESFDELTDELTARQKNGDISRFQLRNFTRSAVEAKLDTAGRITLPRNLLEQAGLVDQVRIMGALDHIEIMAADKSEAMFGTAEAAHELSSMFEGGPAH